MSSMIEIASSPLPLHLQNLPLRILSPLSRQAVRVGMVDDGEQQGDDVFAVLDRASNLQFIVNGKEYLKWNNIKIQLAIRPHGILGCERGCLLMERELKVSFRKPNAPYQLIN
jgi:hypothetical protein